MRTLPTSHLASVGLVVMWSSGFVGARLGTDTAPADTLLAWRYLLAAAVLVIWMAVRGTWVPSGSGVRHAVVGLLTQCGYLGGIVTGVGMGVPAGMAALTRHCSRPSSALLTKVSTLLYLTPPTTMLWAFVMFGDPVTAAGLAGLAVCAVAVWLVLSRPHRPVARRVPAM